jgi:hypothetical protein
MPSKNNDKQQATLTIPKGFKQDATRAEKNIYWVTLYCM